ncbi:MAG: cupin domain-containing protein [Candidatus Dormibacteraeota bacterium]|nr:cupin domain-containing protein [Candidatus Dormibacteraeota bacterium]
MAPIRRGEHMSQDVKPPQGGFTGAAEQRTLHESGPAPVRVSFVRFEPGVTTHWHSHGGGQVLHVVEGAARVQNWGEPVVELHEGDTISAAPGQKHWHGAAQEKPMAHLAVTIGAVNWMEAPDRD